MQISIRHTIDISIGEGPPRGVEHLLLTPQAAPVQAVKEWRIEAPGIDDAMGFVDAYGNRAHLCSQTKPEGKITIVASGIVETVDRHGVVGRLERDPVPALFRRVTPLTRPMGAIVKGFQTPPRTGNERIGTLHALMARVEDVMSTARPEQGQSQAQGEQSQSQTQGAITPAKAADHAHAFIGAARALDIPARFVTGYLVPEEAGEALFHAWAEAWDDGLGWIGFDAMLGLCPTERHVRVASGLDGLSTVPVRSVPVAASPLASRVEIA